METVTSTLKTNKGTIKIEAVHNKKIQFAIMLVSFNTTEKELLNIILQSYKHEKCLSTGVNMNNGISSCITGETSICLIIPENKITQNISLLYAYISKVNLNGEQSKLCGNGNYSKLSKDINSFEVYITGKCKTFINVVKNNATKINTLISQINSIEPKERSNISIKKQESDIGLTIPFEGGSTEACMYLSICLKDVPCKISKDSVTLLSVDGIERIRGILKWKKGFQASVKSFLVQSGSIGSPAANDKDKSKFNQKCKNILKCQNMLATIYSKLRGFNFTFSDESALKSVKADLLNKVKGIKVK